MSTSTDTIEQLANTEYKYGFETDVEADTFAPGLNEDVVRRLSAIKKEPEWLLEFRLKAFRGLADDDRAALAQPQDRADRLPGAQLLLGAEEEAAADEPRRGRSGSAEDVRQARHLRSRSRSCSSGVAVDAVFDSVSVATTFRSKLAELGIIFCSFSEAVHDHPDLVKKYLGSVVPLHRQLLRRAQLRRLQRRLVLPTFRRASAARWSCRPTSASTRRTPGQFERTLLIADEGAHVSYLEGCTAPMRDENQLHAAVVELVALDDATIKYSTIQNWYPGDKDGKGGIYNFVTKRGQCDGATRRSRGRRSRPARRSPGSTRAASCRATTRSASSTRWPTTNNRQQADTGTKMIHIGKNTRSTIVSKGISAGHGQNTYRGPVKIAKSATGARNYSQCDSLLIGDQCGAHTFPYLEIKNTSAKVEHEASTSKIGEDQLFYCRQRGISMEDAVNMIVSGFCKEVFRELPMEFAVEAQKLLSISLEGSVG